MVSFYFEKSILIWKYFLNSKTTDIGHVGIYPQAKLWPASIPFHTVCTSDPPAPVYVRPNSSLCSFANSFLWSLASPAPIYRLSLEVYTNCETKVPLGNGLSRNADLGTASGTGPTHGHSLISFGLN